MTEDTRLDIKDGVAYDEEYLAAEECDGFDEHHIRAEVEDDDGYDPYSDRVEATPLFERDPWD